MMNYEFLGWSTVGKDFDPITDLITVYMKSKVSGHAIGSATRLSREMYADLVDGGSFADQYIRHTALKAVKNFLNSETDAMQNGAAFGV